MNITSKLFVLGTTKKNFTYQQTILGRIDRLTKKIIFVESLSYTYVSIYMGQKLQDGKKVYDVPRRVGVP